MGNISGGFLGVFGWILRGVARDITRLAAVALCAGFAHAQAPSMSVAVVDRTTPREAISAPACLRGASLRIHVPAGAVNRAEIGAWVVVDRHPDPRFDGVYRIVERSFTRDRDRAVVNTILVAVCAP
jgi:hypothetical protein